MYISGDELERAGLDPDDPPPEFRVWVGERGRMVLTFYPVTT